MKNLIFLNKIISQKKLRLVEPSKEISISYRIKSDNCLKSAKILFEANLFENSISESYYAMYNNSLSLLFFCGIKCENHTATIILLENLFGLTKLNKALEFAKKERIDKQYYVLDEKDSKITKDSAFTLIQDAEYFILDQRAFIEQLDNMAIQELRNKFINL